ncbi:MAG: hypothetical protein AAGA18_05750 [Verrucomicrobiota bacterium]
MRVKEIVYNVMENAPDDVTVEDIIQDTRLHDSLERSRHKVRLFKQSL